MELRIELNHPKKRIIASDVFYNANSNYLILALKENHFILQVSQEKCTVEIFISFEGKQYSHFSCDVSNILLSQKSLKIFLLEKIPEYVYDQNVIEVFKLWQKNQDCSFYEQSVSLKKAWLTASFFYSGLPSKMSKSEIEINCLDVVDEYDLFFLLGESLIGSKGYLGRDFNGVRDCLFLMGKVKGIRVVFKNSFKLDSLFEQIDGFTKEEFLDDFFKLGYILLL